MPREWMDVSQLSFNTLLLLEQVQLSWLPGWLPEKESLNLVTWSFSGRETMTWITIFTSFLYPMDLNGLPSRSHVME